MTYASFRAQVTHRSPLLTGLLCLAIALPLSGAPGDRVYVPGQLFRAPAAQKSVFVKPFFMDRFAVSNEQYALFLAEHPEWRRSRVKRIFADESYLRNWPADENHEPGMARSPLINVSWFAARAYCNWRSGRLPTQLEWERTAAEPALQQMKVGSSVGRSIEELVLAWYAKPSLLPLPPVGSTYQNRLGVYDMHGLVWEWVEDFNSLPVTGDSRTGLDRNLFCAGGAGAGMNPADYAAYMRYAFRSSLQANFSLQNLGFRCAYDAGSEP